MFKKIIEVFESRRTVMIEVAPEPPGQVAPPVEPKIERRALPKKALTPDPHHTAKLALHKVYHTVFGQHTQAKLESVGVDPNGKTVGYFTAYVPHPFDGKTYRHCWRYGIGGTPPLHEYVQLEHIFPCKPR